MNAYDLNNICILDIEASGLSSDSWPIEMGLSWVYPRGPQTWSSLIRPAPDWPESAWDPAAEEVHGIAATELDWAPEAAEVAEALLHHAEGRILMSDAPSYDGFWLRQLLRAAGIKREIQLVDYGVWVCNWLDQDLEQLTRFQAHLDTTEIPHRAGADAEMLMKALLDWPK
ncbi:MAG: exonuclease domain-containing protein [Paracoccus sp. (in: a-proteobacteria)]|uniref:exonuclease domain-containing protein n=1 Tax=Paracoccus sp. TaxID=267 RepID=UPI0026DF1228|nr:exonuclease domain-containing protein [Paracoccus sp. (in: a-proteobacteria)]MDO5632531.1 exonuclease domain-containing protein [Paracoccus sp. (in: a-proteobacteria)]